MAELKEKEKDVVFKMAGQEMAQIYNKSCLSKQSSRTVIIKLRNLVLARRNRFDFFIVLLTYVYIYCQCANSDVSDTYIHSLIGF